MTIKAPVGKLIAATVLVIAMAASANAAGVDQTLHDAVPSEYQKNGVNVAAFNDWPPDEFVENGELKGWSIDMAKAMSEKLGIDFKFTPTSFDAIIPGLASKRFDAGFSSFGVTEERLEVLDFVPQRKEGTAYAFLKEKSFDIQSEKDLCGHSIAVLTGAWDFQYLTKVSDETCVKAGATGIDLQQFTTQKRGGTCRFVRSCRNGRCRFGKITVSCPTDGPLWCIEVDQQRRIQRHRRAP